MSEKTKMMLELVDMLPETEQSLIEEMIKRIVLAWDPDFTKVTASEIERLKQIEKEGGSYSHEEAWEGIA